MRCRLVVSRLSESVSAAHGHQHAKDSTRTTRKQRTHAVDEAQRRADLKAEARKSGSNAITGGIPCTVTGTWMVADFPSLSTHVSVSGPGRPQLKRTDNRFPVSERSQAMSAAR